ncbi:MAG TPA: sodium:proton antiporter [Gammaproteobacteria bacterium]|nr:sodium:proton antiporter [Gammaproteobacteria bacterium]
MNQIETYILLLGIIFIVGILFNKKSAPLSLLLVIVGMILSFVPEFPRVQLEPQLVLNVFLPLLVYEASAQTSWREVKKDLRPIALLSVGHVLFITVLVASVLHAVVPGLSWSLCFVLGAVISPPDDIAIVALAEKLYLPRRIITILTAEGLFNDATALVIFRFALVAVVTQEFSFTAAIDKFLVIVLCEIVYGIALGFIIGEIRLRLKDAKLQILISLLTPFLAYTPAVMLGGSGVLATVVAGILLGHRYMHRFAPEIRLLGTSVWSMLVFLLQSILFLLIGLELRFIVERITSMSIASLALYSLLVVAVVIVGRFLWVFPAAYLPRFLFPAIRKKDPYPKWQYLFIIAWSGMRGGISLAAALAVPLLPPASGISSPKDLLVFLVFSVIFLTLILQGLALPWVVKVLGIQTERRREKLQEHMSELSARLTMTKAVLRWLLKYRTQVKEDAHFYAEINTYIKQYQILRKRITRAIENHDDSEEHDELKEVEGLVIPSAEIIKIERKVLEQLWVEKKITQAVRNKLLLQLDFRSRYFG